MATTNIELDIENITGVADADDQLIISAQKFVVSSVPKELLKFAQKASSASTDGSAISFSVNDSIIGVARNGYSCMEIPLSEAAWALDSSSLRFATARHPVWYHKQGAVHFAPVTDGSNAGYVFYVDFSLIDDNCDLRNAVIYRACANEFSKLASSSTPTISISAVPPDVPTLSSTSVSFGTSAPTYTKPSLTTRVSFEDFYNTTEDSNPFGDNDPGALTVSVSAPTINITAPGVTTTAKADISGDVPSYTAPTVGGATESLTGTMTAGATSTDADKIDFSDWFDILADMIEDDEDTELAAAQLQKINTYINAYQTEIQNSLNTFNKDNVRYQANVQAEIQKQSNLASENTLEAQQTLEATVQDATLELQKYQAQVNDEISEYQQKLSRYQTEINLAYTAWQTTEANSLSIYQSDIQNELNEFNKENAEYQAQLQVSIQNAQLDNEEDARKLTKYQAELQQYASEVNSEVSEYQSKLQQQQAYSADSQKYYNWAQNEIDNYIKNNSKIISASLARQGSSQ